MKPSNYILISAVTLLSSTFLAGCSTNGINSTKLMEQAKAGAQFMVGGKEHHDKNIIVLIDFSKHTKQNDDNKVYYKNQYCNIVIPSVTAKTKLVVLPIDRSSNNAATELQYFDMMKHEDEIIPEGTSAIDEDKVTKRNAKKIKDSLSNGFSMSFESIAKAREKSSVGTDVIAAINNAITYCDTTENNIIVIFSDMLQYANGVNMENSEFTEADIQKWLSQFPALHLVNTKIIVLTGPINSNNQFDNGRKFWKLYFEKNNIVYKYESEDLETLRKGLE